MNIPLKEVQNKFPEYVGDKHDYGFWCPKCQIPIPPNDNTSIEWVGFSPMPEGFHFCGTKVINIL